MCARVSQWEPYWSWSPAKAILLLSFAPLPRTYSFPSFLCLESPSQQIMRARILISGSASRKPELKLLGIDEFFYAIVLLLI